MMDVWSVMWRVMEIEDGKDMGKYADVNVQVRCNSVHFDDAVKCLVIME